MSVLQAVTRDREENCWELACGHDITRDGLHIGDEVECASCTHLEALARRRRRDLEAHGVVFLPEGAELP